MYSVRKINSDEVNEALALALEVFMQFEAPDYTPEGVATFKHVIENEEFINKCKQGICPTYAAFDDDKMIGMIGMRSNRTHITANTLDNNIGAQKLLEKCGFVLEGRERRFVYLNSEMHDRLNYAILKEEFLAMGYDKLK